MKLVTAARIVADLSRKGVRQNYWDLSRMVSQITRLTRPENRVFRGRVLRELGWYVAGGPTPIHGQSRERARAAVEWHCRAQDAGDDDGAAKG